MMPEMAAKLYISVSKNDIEMKEFILRFGRMVVIASSCFLLGITNASAQKVLRKSENMRPVWLVSKTPETTNETFHYQLVEAENESLEKARHDCLLALSRYIEQAWKISGEAETDIRMEQKNGAYKESSVYNFHYKIENEEINVTTTKYDEYWEYVYYPGGGRYHCYVLFGVADVPGSTVRSPVLYPQIRCAGNGAFVDRSGMGTDVQRKYGEGTMYPGW